MLTERDTAILQFINQFGFCEMPHINQQFNLRFNRNYKIMGKLIKEGYVIHEKTNRNRHGIYRLTKQGALETDLPRIKQVPAGIYDHEILLIQLYFKLMLDHPAATFISERHLAWEKHQDGIGKRTHVADGVLVLNDHKKIFIELERSLKGKRRLEKILRDYAMQSDMDDEIWYFCEEKVLPTLRKLAGGREYIKVYSLREYLHASS